jgi:hypothetical protein
MVPWGTDPRCTEVPWVHSGAGALRSRRTEMWHEASAFAKATADGHSFSDGG